MNSEGRPLEGRQSVSSTYQFPEASIIEANESTNRSISLAGVVSHILVSNQSPIDTFDLKGTE